MTDTNNTTTPAQAPKRRFSGLGGVLVTLLGLALAGILALFIGTTIGLRLDNNCFSWSNWGETQTICFTDASGDDLLIPPARKDGDSAPAEAEVVDEEDAAPAPAPAHVVIDDEPTPVRAVIIDDEPKAEIVLASETRVSPPAKRWVGIIAVKESPLVNQVIRESGNNPGIYGMQLHRMLRSGEVEAASGNYCYIPYNGGEPSDEPECVYTRSGITTRWAPGSMVWPGKAMCVSVPRSWPAIVGQLRYPERGGRKVNCYDFGDEAYGANFAGSRGTAAMIVVVEPAGL